MADTVAAVVVTYNRSGLLVECIEALLRQIHSVDRIIIVDNASTDETAQVLKSRGYLDCPNIDYVRLAYNTGGAGGFHEGMKRAHEAGFDWIWVMDDDAEPYPDALERMQTSFSRDAIGGVANLTIGLDGQPQIEHRGWLDLNSTRQRAHRAIDAAALTGELAISFASFVGLAVHRKTIDRIGLPKREMFIKADDLEYCVRLASVGPLILVPDSKILHKEAGSSNFQLRRRFGLRSSRPPLDKLWLNYFGLRNLLWIRRQHCGDSLAARFALRQYLRLLPAIVIFDSHRWVRMRFYWHAIRDAWAGVFDNDKPVRLTKLS